jgi:hypothetical protein
MQFTWPGSSAEKRLTSFCKKFDLKAAPDFYGFMFGGSGFLYRYGNASAVFGKSNKKEYERMTWKKPLGRKQDRDKFQFVIFHADKGQEIIFAFSKSDIEKMIRADRIIETVINIPFHKDSIPRGWRAKFLENPIPPDKLIATLRRLTKGRS